MVLTSSTLRCEKLRNTLRLITAVIVLDNPLITRVHPCCYTNDEKIMFGICINRELRHVMFQ